MKNLIQLFSIVLIFSLLLSCHKEEPIPPTIVKGQVLEQGSNKPLEGVKVVLMEGTFSGSSGSYSYYPIDTFLTDKNGMYSYEHKLAASRKAYELWYAKDSYFDISNISFNDRTTRVSLNKTLNTTIKLVPFAWLTIRVVNDMPFNNSDQIKIRLNTDSGKDYIFEGNTTNNLIIEKVYGGSKTKFKWSTYKNNIWNHSFLDSVYCTPHDTTFYQIKY